MAQSHRKSQPPGAPQTAPRPYLSAQEDQSFQPWSWHTGGQAEGKSSASDVSTQASRHARADRRAPQATDALALIGAVSHEMRNPLNGIVGMTHLLRDTQLDAAQRSYLDGIETSGDVLLRLVNDLLDLTALRASAVALNREPTDIAALINQCIELAAPAAHAKDLTLGSVIDAAIDPALTNATDAPLRPALDEARLRQVISNLLSNAVKFTQSGGVCLTARLVRQQGQHQLQIDIEDTGSGIDAADQTLIFEPFGRTRGAQQAAISGTGLGLPLSRELARAMGGDLVVARSCLGEGTVMRLAFPLDDVSQVAALRPPLAGQKVMLVLAPHLAHSPEADALTATLESLGADAEIHDTLDALKVAPQGFDHVLVDARFDHAMLWARLCLPPAGVRPIILLRPDHRSILPGLQEAGFSGYLIRPVRQSSLLCMLTHRFDASSAAPFLSDPADNARLRKAATPLKILLADDNAINALLARTALEKAGHSVVVAEDGAEAVQHVEGCEEPFDTVLLDLSMPGMDGFEAAQAMRAGGYGGQLIAYTGNTDSQLHARADATGFDAVAHKPLQPQVLLALLDRHLDTPEDSGVADSCTQPQHAS